MTRTAAKQPEMMGAARIIPETQANAAEIPRLAQAKTAPKLIVMTRNCAEMRKNDQNCCQTARNYGSSEYKTRNAGERS